MKLFRLNVQKESLIRRCIEGDRKAQQQLFEQYAPIIMTICKRYLKQNEEAEEILQNVFIKAFSNLSSVSEDGNFEAWLKKIAVNESLNQLRYKRNVFVEIEDETDDYQAAVGTPYGDPYEAEALMKMVESLPIGYRTVFNLAAIEGYSHNEIADMLGISESTSRSQLTKARQILQKQITQSQYLTSHGKASNR